MLIHGKRRPTGAGDLLTRVKVHKGVGSLAVASGGNSDGTEDALGCDGVISFLSGLYVRTKLDLIMLVEFKTVASDYAFGADGAVHPIFSGDGVIPKDVDED